MKRPRRTHIRRTQRTHPPVASGQQDYRGVEICGRCDSVWDASVHGTPELTDDQRQIEARKIGEKP